MKVLVKTIVSLLIVIVSAGVTFWLYSNKPKTGKSRPRKPIPIVSTVAISPTDQTLFIEAFGTVIPAGKTTLSSEVEGRLTAISPELVPGGIVEKGQFLARIDRKDYELLVKERRTEVTQARFQLEIEQGKQIIAKREWKLFEKNSAAIESSKELALREPHLKNAKAILEAAESRLAAAELDMERTTINAPFNAMVLEEFAEVGQWFGRQTPIATLVNTDRFWIQVSVPPSELSHLKFPDADDPTGSHVEIIVGNDNKGLITRRGRLFKLLGDLDPKGRMARVLVTVDDPFALRNDGPGQPENSVTGKILLGSYVRVRIDGGLLKNVYAIPRPAIRGSDQVWILTSENRLDIRPVDIQWRRKNELLVSLDLAPGEKIITSRIGAPLPGMKLRTAEERTK